MNCSPTIGALAAALAKANLELSNPGFDKKNNHYNNGYASLAAVLNAIRQPLAKQGLSLVQMISTAPESVTITTTLLHSSGEWLSSDVSVAVVKNATAQAVGGATTYMRRYSALAMCGIAGDDDDAEEDRRDREERKPMATPVSRPQKAPAAPPPALSATKASGTPAPTSVPRASEGLLKKWPSQGCDAVLPEKIVERAAGVSAVLFSHATDGRQWVSVPHSMISAVKLNQRCQLEWEWNDAGYYEARSISKIDLSAVRKDAPAPVATSLGDDALPF